ncbi:proteasome inhibitor PI31 subunit [Malaya genurostris]|uniref:proteasome inhibitor PI31 subunit n=1 Tax=Malaya genurostris TaxID=325434 RepID=UPI0026F3D4A1|nr:proteasome inhibitor PI31 subunit [Malaya genurostris]XP_058460412.1 proteasome inhibitor PI31 subunit [Malaya genurostris]
MAENDYFGLELLFKSVEATIQTKSDVLIAVVHWYLIKNSFRNVGIGDDKTLSDGEETSELLPDGWNSNPHSYSLRYMNNGQLYILHGIDSEGTMIVNLLQVKTLNVSNTTFQIEDTVKAVKGSATTMITELPSVLDRIRMQLLVPVFESNKKDGETQTAQSSKEPVKTEREPSSLIIGPRLPGRLPGSDPLGVGNVGRGDLDPFGRGGGGMIFEPPGGFNPLGNLRQPGPFGNIPGARFDPFGPVVGNNPRQFRNPDPNPDHLPPPGYDDMFM